MGLFDKITKVMSSLEKIENSIESIVGNPSRQTQDARAEKRNVYAEEEVVVLPSSRMVEETEFGDNDSQYRVSFCLNEAFKEANSHAGEVTMLYTYAPENEYGEEGKVPYIAIQSDDDVYCPVEEFKARGTFNGAIALTPLGGTFYFKAKKEYYGNMMYFYGLDRCDGFWTNNGLCLVYPKSYVGTENEAKLMRVLDEAAESYQETRVK